MDANEVKATLRLMMDRHQATGRPPKLPPNFRGPPGAGKSEVIEQAAREAGWEFFVSHPSQWGPGDIQMPDMSKLNEEVQAWKRPGVIPRLDCPWTVYLVDETDKITPLVQNMFLSLLTARHILGHRLSDKVLIVGASNRVQDQSGSQRRNEAFQLRWTWLDFTVALLPWIRHAQRMSFHAMVVAYVSWRGLPALYNWKPAQDAFRATGRTWEGVSDRLYEGLTGEPLREAVTGCVGEAEAAPFLAFAEVFGKVPTFGKIMLDPQGTEIPDEPSLQHAVATRLIQGITVGNVDDAYPYVRRLPGDLQTYVMHSLITLKDKDGKSAHDGLQATPAFVDWLHTNTDMIQ